MHNFTFLDNTASFVLNSSCVETSSVTMAVKHPIWTIVSTWKSCFPEAWIINGGYYNGTCCIA